MTEAWLEHLAGAISKRARRQDTRPRYAAVLVPIVWVEGELSLLLTRRTERLSTHKGHVAFPGGRADETDQDAQATALREAHEEVGLPSHHVSILGQLDDFPTVTDDMIVTPVVGYIERLPTLVPNQIEVARIFTIPISALLKPERWVTKYWDKQGLSYPVYYFDWDGETLWGLSAYITLQLLALSLDGGPIRLPKPYG